MYDVIVIGGGPAGYVAAIRAAQNKLKVACVDYDNNLGGTCLNRGCIPSKTLLDSSHHYHSLKHDLAQHGITCSNVKIDIKKLMTEKTNKLMGLANGIGMLFKKHKIDRLSGIASFESNDTIVVNKVQYKAKNFIIATGSVPACPPNIELDEERIVSSNGALSWNQVPKKLIVVGGGYIGLELGFVWHSLGAEVQIIEYGPSIMFGMDSEITKAFGKILQQKGINVMLSTKVNSATTTSSGVTLAIDDMKNKTSSTIECSHVLFATGRKPYTDNLKLDNAGVKIDDTGRILVNDSLQTSQPTIYAIGDVIKGPMLAHKASEEGVFVADLIAKKTPHHIDYSLIPAIMYTHPEIASIGKTEEQLQQDNIPYKKGKFFFAANSRARAVGSTDGFVKILSCKSTDRVLGCHIIGNDAGTIIHEVVILMAFGGSSEDLALICHAHPTLNEAVKEAALDVEGLAIHS